MIQLPGWYEAPVSKSHDRDNFDCGNSSLNDYLKRHARKNHERGGAKTFLAISKSDQKSILGFYSLCPASLEYARVPKVISRDLARYDVPVFRLCRLAVQREFQGKGLGGQLLLTAGRRCLLAATEVGGVALLIDAKDDFIAEWYASYGAVPLLNFPLSLLLPLSTIEEALRIAGFPIFQPLASASA